ncbi:MAG: hypothetical protein ACHQUB_03460 [Candidatus Saccharimonadia bacterium]
MMVKTKTRTLIIFSLCIIVIALISAFGLVYFSSPIPPSIRRNVSFGIFYPKSSNYHCQRSSFAYDPQAKIVTYVCSNASLRLNLNITEQASPDGFVDAPQAFETLINKLQNYASFDSVVGKVYLTHPVELNGGQTAVMDGEGTLVFIRPTNAISEDNWRKLFNSLNLYH